MHPRPRGALLAVLAAALTAAARIPAGILRAASADDPPSGATYPTHHRSRGGWGQGKKRYHEIRGGVRVPVAPGFDRPAVHAGKFPSDGTHIECGVAVRPSGKPHPSNKVKRRRAEKRLAAKKASSAATAPKRRKSGGEMRTDAKGLLRYHRRAGVISARQQRKALRGWRARHAQDEAQP